MAVQGVGALIRSHTGFTFLSFIKIRGYNNVSLQNITQMGLAKSGPGINKQTTSKHCELS